VAFPRTEQLLTHGVSSPVVARATPNHVLNLRAATRDGYNRAGAFAVLDTLLKLAEGVQAASAEPLGSLTVYWPSLGSATYVGPNRSDPTMFLLGGSTKGNDLTGDHDEFDEAVIAHEFVHFLMLTKSRDASWGGPHNGEALVPLAAYSEGLPTALGNLLLGTRDYIDTAGVPPKNTEQRYFLDCENPSFVPGVPGTGVSGYASEFAVMAVVWDLLDGPANGVTSTDGDPVSIALSDFLASLFALRNRPGPDDVTWLAPLLQQLVDDGHLTAVDANTLLTPHNASFPPAAGDLWLTDITPGSSEAGTLDASTGPAGTPRNSGLGLNANRVFRLELAAPASLTLVLRCDAAGYDAKDNRLEVEVYDLERNVVAWAYGDDAVKSLPLSLGAGTFLVRVAHTAQSPDQTPFTLEVP
jgi:hypothetical protein